MARQPQWTESIAVGSRPFVETIAQTVSHRQHLECLPAGLMPTGERSTYEPNQCLK